MNLHDEYINTVKARRIIFYHEGDYTEDELKSLVDYGHFPQILIKPEDAPLSKKITLDGQWGKINLQ
tara:strand:+ start:98 stop:298 length:201 start_codon:yes stop_codon:yes gene_type:complete